MHGFRSFVFFSSFLRDPVSKLRSCLGQGRGQKQAGCWQDISKCPWDLESLFWTHLRQSNLSFIPVNFIKGLQGDRNG